MEIALKQCGLLGQVPQPGWLAQLALLPLKVLLNITQKVEYHKKGGLSVIRRMVILQSKSNTLQSKSNTLQSKSNTLQSKLITLQSNLDILQGTLAGHLKSSC